MAQARRRPARKPWFAERTTGDLLIMAIASTICFAVLASGAAVALLAIIQPERNLAPMVNMIGDVVNTMIGLLAGFLAGRTDAHMTMTRNADGSRTWDVDRSANARETSATADI